MASEGADWQEVIRPLADPVLQAVLDASASGDTAGQVLDRLTALLQSEHAPDAGPLAEHLAHLAGAARLAANAGAGADT